MIEGDYQKNGCYLLAKRGDVVLPKPDVLLKDGQTIILGSSTLEIIHTPGHTPGGICIRTGDILITGDTLFETSIGRTDLYGGSSRQLNDSIKNKLFTLPDDTKVYPGHGPATSIGFERKNNPYVC